MGCGCGSGLAGNGHDAHGEGVLPDSVPQTSKAAITRDIFIVGRGAGKFLGNFGVSHFPILRNIRCDFPTPGFNL